MKKKYGSIIITAIIVTVAAVIFLPKVMKNSTEKAPETRTYEYHNLQTSEKIDEVGEMLKAGAGVSDEVWNLLVDDINYYNDKNYIKDQLEKDWSKYLLGETKYKINVFYLDDKEYEEYERQLEVLNEDLNCRITAFLLMKDMIKANDSVEKLNQTKTEEIDLMKINHTVTKKEEELFSLLFRSVYKELHADHETGAA
ncbi:MAG: DUF4300 family protein, partial [Roseburia sp.]